MNFLIQNMKNSIVSLSQMFLLKDSALVESQSCDSSLVTAGKRSLGQGNIFAPVCHSVHRAGVYPSMHLAHTI